MTNGKEPTLARAVIEQAIVDLAQGQVDAATFLVKGNPDFEFWVTHLEVPSEQVEKWAWSEAQRLTSFAVRVGNRRGVERPFSDGPVLGSLCGDEVTQCAKILPVPWLL